MEPKELRFRKGLGRIVNAWLLLARSKRALFGMGVILFFVFTAIFAPYLATLSCGYSCDPSSDSFLGDDHSAPAWFRTLGLEKGLSGNVELAQGDEKGFTTAGSLTAWTFKTNRPGTVSFEYSDLGRDTPGSVEVIVTPRAQGSSYGTLTFSIEKSLGTYPYDGPPGKFFGTGAILLQVLGIDLVIAGIAPVSGTVLEVDSQGRIAYVDTNGNNVWDSTETVVYDIDGSGFFDLGEEVIFGAVRPRVGTALKLDLKIKFFDQNSNNARNAAEVVIYDTNDSDAYDAPPRIDINAFIDQDFNRIRYVDTNDNNVWDSGETVVSDTNGSGLFDSRDLIVSGTSPPGNAILKDDTNIRYVDSNGNDIRDSSEVVVYDGNGNGLFEAEEIVLQGTTPSGGTSLKIGKPSFMIWDLGLPSNGQYPETWTIPDPPIDSTGTLFKGKFFGGQSPEIHPEAIVFTQKVLYTYRLEVTVRDNNPSAPLNVSVNIDDLSITLLGTSFGLLGTDQQGRDLFTQLAYGARISLTVGLISAALGIIVGLAVGLLSGFKGGVVDEGLMRFTDMLLVLPGLPLLLVLVAVLSPSIWTIIGVLGLLGWMGFARVIRSQVVSLKERPFVEASKAVGSGTGHLIVRHILPNVMGLTYVSLATSVPGAITAEAALSFLGLFDPFLMSWGRILFNAQSYQGFFQWWWVLPPGIAIALLSLSFILIGYALDDILNPRLRQRR